MKDERKKVERSEAKVSLSKALSSALYELDIEVQDLAAPCGVGRSFPGRWASRACGDTMTLVDVALVGRGDDTKRELSKRLLGWAADQLGCLVVERVRHGGAAVRDHLEHAVRVMKESSEAAQAYMAGLATHGGHFTDDELEHLDRELRESEHAHAALRAWVDEEKRARVVPTLAEVRARGAR